MSSLDQLDSSCESVIEGIYDELDGESDLVLRTLVDFRLIDDTGAAVSIDSLGAQETGDKPKRVVKAIGRLLLPLHDRVYTFLYCN